jgi:ferredoxin
MRVRVELDKCYGSGQCVLAAPEVFDQRDADGTALVLAERPAPGAVVGARAAAAACPAAAIVIEEG